MPRYNPHKTNRTAPKRNTHPWPSEKWPESGPQKPAPNAPPVLTENEEKDGYELRFPTKPSDVVLKLFRETAFLPQPQKWHWHFKAKFWYAKRNEATREFAELVISQSSGLPKVEAPVVPAEQVAQAFVGEIVTEQALSETESKGLSVLAASAPPNDAPEPENVVEQDEREYKERAIKALLSGRSGVIPAQIEHEQFPRSLWALEVQDGSTRMGYEQWVEAKMDLAAEEPDEQPEQERVIPCNVVPMLPELAEAVQIKAAVNQSPVPDWRSRFSWSNTQRQRERGQLPGQAGSGRFINRE